MFVHNLEEDSTAARCLDLIARHAPRLMRVGGGALVQERRSRRGGLRRIAPEVFQEVVQRARESGAPVHVLAQEFRLASSTVRRALQAAGVRVRDGRRG